MPFEQLTLEAFKLRGATPPPICLRQKVCAQQTEYNKSAHGLGAQALNSAMWAWEEQTSNERKKACQRENGYA